MKTQGKSIQVFCGIVSIQMVGRLQGGSKTSNLCSIYSNCLFCWDRKTRLRIGYWGFMLTFQSCIKSGTLCIMPGKRSLQKSPSYFALLTHFQTHVTKVRNHWTVFFRQENKQEKIKLKGLLHFLHKQTVGTLCTGKQKRFVEQKVAYRKIAGKMRRFLDKHWFIFSSVSVSVYSRKTDFERKKIHKFPLDL